MADFEAEPFDSGIAATREQIMDKLRWEAAQPGGRIRGTKIFDGQLADGERAPTDSKGKIQPYIAVVWGGRGKSNQGHQGITSSKRNLKRLTFGIECYAATDGILHDLSDRVLDILDGFEPINAGEITGFNSGRIENPAQIVQNHTRPGIGLLFECMTGTITPDTP